MLDQNSLEQHSHLVLCILHGCFGLIHLTCCFLTGIAPEQNTTADLLYSMTDSASDMQLFWEAFPAEGGKARTTYMFAYSDAHPGRPTFEQLLDTYFKLLPSYQNTTLEQLKFKRVLFGGFPCYSQYPLQSKFDRVLQLGDASACQSPLSFGGFGSMLRHVGRLSRAIMHALGTNHLSHADLALIQPYQPSLSAAWLFQKSMSVGLGQIAGDTVRPNSNAQQHNTELSGASTKLPGAVQSQVEQATHVQKDDSIKKQHEHKEHHAASSSFTAVKDMLQHQQDALTHPRAQNFAWLRFPANHINQLLAVNFATMRFLGEWVLKPFLQDTIQLVPLTLTMTGMMLANPVAIIRVLLQVRAAVTLRQALVLAAACLLLLLHVVV